MFLFEPIYFRNVNRRKSTDNNEIGLVQLTWELVT